jgi:hypothetical protein
VASSAPPLLTFWTVHAYARTSVIITTVEYPKKR